MFTKPEEKPPVDLDSEPDEGDDEYWKVDQAEQEEGGDPLVIKEPSDSSAQPEPELVLVKVFVADTVAQSRLIQMKLSENGIESVIEETGMSIFPLAGESIDALTILVPQETEEKAKSLITEFLRESREGRPSSEKKKPDSARETQAPAQEQKNKKSDARPKNPRKQS